MSHDKTPIDRKKQLRKFKKEREELMQAYFNEFNTHVFRNQLPANLTLVWNKKLRTTAGITRTKLSIQRDERGLPISAEPIYSATIELSDKVIDSEERLRQTLAHEMCHAGAWLIDHSLLTLILTFEFLKIANLITVLCSGSGQRCLKSAIQMTFKCQPVTIMKLSSSTTTGA